MKRYILVSMLCTLVSTVWGAGTAAPMPPIGGWLLCGAIRAGDMPRVQELLKKYFDNNPQQIMIHSGKTVLQATEEVIGEYEVIVKDAQAELNKRQAIYDWLKGLASK